MDPFRIISQYNTRKLSETLLSSFLNYFLNPQEDHGLAYTFIGRFTEQLGLIPPESFADSRAFWSKRPEVRIFHEHDLGRVQIDGKLQDVGRIDSLVTVKFKRDVWIVATEVKIHDSSAKNTNKDGTPQLQRYFTALRELAEPDSDIRKSIGWEESNRLRCITLVYLVPSESSVWAREVEVFLAAHRDALHPTHWCPTFRIVPWREAEEVRARSSVKNGPSEWVTEHSLADIVKWMLQEHSVGHISQLDPHALHLLRCIQFAAVNDFKYDFPLRYGQFPDHEGFEATLTDAGQWPVFESLVEASGATRATANSLHTSIGIPITMPKTMTKNSLLAIRTTRSYAEGQPITEVECEFDKDRYEKFKDRLQSLVDVHLIPGSGVFDAAGLVLQPGVHPDANEADNDKRREVYVLTLKKGEEFATASAVRMLRGFFVDLRLERFGVETIAEESGAITCVTRAD